MNLPDWFTETETVSVCVPDHLGRLSGKRIASIRLPEILIAGLPAPDFHLITDPDLEPVPGLSAAGAETGYRNGLFMPLAETLRRVPWDSTTSIILAEACRRRGVLIEESPRNILRRQVHRLAEMGLSTRIATELEFYVFRQSYFQASVQHYSGLTPYYHRSGDNDVLVTSFLEPFVSSVRDAARSFGFPAEATQGEGGAGQVEINFGPQDPLAAADCHVLFKHGVKAIAQSQGVAATFMAKVATATPGSSCHINLSLADDTGRSLMCAETSADPPQLRTEAKSFLSGLVAYSPELTLMHAPFANSYRRYNSGGLAPRNVSWGRDNRTTMVRVVGSGPSLRLELRLPGADCNPYLSLAGVLAAGIAGLQRRPVLPPPVIGDAFSRLDLPSLPLDLGEALAAFEGSPLAAAAFGEQVQAHVAGLARHELDRARREVSDGEVSWGFEVS
jgi:glutamine synthetase